MIRLQFSRAAGLSSDIIAWFDGLGIYSHVDVVCSDGQLLGARLDGGVQVRPADYEAFTRRGIVDLPSSAHVDIAFWAWLRRQVGKPYDRTAILGFAAGRSWREPDSWFCSELVAAALEISLWFARPLLAGVNKITPDELALVLSSYAPFTDAAI